MIHVYIASPYTVGNKLENVRRSLSVAHDLIKFGLCPICPLLTHYQHELFPEPYDTWLRLDIERLKRTDCVLRLDGESKGADAEVKAAHALDIPVFNTITDLLDWKEKRTIASTQIHDSVLIE